MKTEGGEVEPREFSIRETVHGPIVHDKDGRVFAAALGVDGTLYALLAERGLALLVPMTTQSRLVGMLALVAVVVLLGRHLIENILTLWCLGMYAVFIAYFAQIWQASDTNLLKTNINALNASGDTYIPTGLMWGWRTLTSEIPYTEAVTAAEAQSKGVSKHIVLMTDGENVTSKSTGSGHHDASI